MRGLLMLACLIASIYAMSRMGSTIPGAWVCSSVSSGMHAEHACTSEPGVHLNGDNTYQWGREKGTWQVKSGILRFSDLRAIGHLNSDGKLVTEFDRAGKHYVLTYYKRW